MKRVFAPDSGFMLFVSRVFDILIVSLLFLLCCIPVITIGPGLCALYNTTRKVVIERKGYVVKEFFHSFLVNLRQGILAWIILLAAAALMFVNVYFVIQTWKGGLAVSLLAVYFAVLLVVIILTAYVFPILASFQCTLKQLFGSAVSMAVAYPVKTLVLGLWEILFYISLVYSFAVFPLALFLIPAGFAAMQKYILGKIFLEYMDVETKESTENL